jgi:pyruvate/2-oxoglutarate dehydrogenase complex dihydrolipoamide dehydrogenase (E3) component
VDPLFGGDEHIMSNHIAFEEDEVIVKKTKKQLTDLGIEIIENVSLVSVNSDDKNQLQSVELMTDKWSKSFNCKILITSGKVSVDEDNFNSIHKNGLVYNGRLIVDNKFRTTDPSIYAAGSLCEISH